MHPPSPPTSIITQEPDLDWDSDPAEEKVKSEPAPSEPVQQEAEPEVHTCLLGIVGCSSNIGLL